MRENLHFQGQKDKSNILVKTAKASIQPRRKYFDILKPNAITRTLPDYLILCSLSIHVHQLMWIRVKHSDKSKAKRIRKEKG